MRGQEGDAITVIGLFGLIFIMATEIRGSAVVYVICVMLFFESSANVRKYMFCF